MSSTRRSSSSGRLAVSAPASMASLPSTRKHVVRWRGSSPPEQPRTRSLMATSPGVPELRLHLEELEELPELHDVGDDEAVGADGDDLRLEELRQHLVRLLRLHADAGGQLLRDDVELVARGALRDLLGGGGEEV